MAALPDFLTMTGTLGKPKQDRNNLVLLGLAAKAGGSIVGQSGTAIGGKAGDILNALGGLAGGGANANAPSTITNADGTITTNQPAAQPVGDLLRGFGNLLGGKKSSESPATNPPANPK
jgi:hypothetical protein